MHREEPEEKSKEIKLWRCGGAVVSTLAGSRLGLCCFVVSSDNKLYSTLSLPTQARAYCKWIPATNAGGNCNGLASHPRGSSNTPSCFILRKSG